MIDTSYELHVCFEEMMDVPFLLRKKVLLSLNPPHTNLLQHEPPCNYM